MTKATATSSKNKVSKKEKRKQEVEESASSSSAAESSSEEESSSSEEEASDSEASSDNEAPAAAKKDTKKKKKAAASDNEDESSDSDSSDAESEKADGSSSSDSGSDSGSGSDSDSDAEEEDSDESAGKRKAGSDVEMEDTEATSKKQKTEEEAEEGGAKVHSVFVGNLAFATTDESLATAFGAFGEVVAARVAMQPNSGRSRGFGYVDFESADAQQKAMEATDFEVDGRTVRMDKTDGHARDSKHSAQRSGGSSEPSKVLFIGNMSFRSTEDSVRQAFEECGTVVSVRIITDRETGRAKGYGYVEFDSVEAAASAMEWNGSDLDGRNIRLDYSTPRQGGNGGSGGRGGGRGGFRGGRGGGRGRGGSRY